MPFLQLPDIELYYEIEGDGPPLLMIPAAGLQGWMTLRTGLAVHHTLIMPDIRPWGRTRPNDLPFELADITSDCAHLLDHLGIARADALGHSFGGLVALDFAAKHPNRTRRVVTMASGISRSKRTLRLFEDLVEARRDGMAADIFFRLIMYWSNRGAAFEDREALVALSRQIADSPLAPPLAAFEAFIGAVRQLTRDQFAVSEITAPMLNIHGADDRALLLVEAEETFAAASNARLVDIADAGHAVHQEQPQAVLDLIIPFLAAAG